MSKWAERMEELEYFADKWSERLFELNCFLQDRPITNKWGEDVSHVAMMYIEVLEKQNKQLQEAFDLNSQIHDKLNKDYMKSKKQNKRYRNLLESVSNTSVIAEQIYEEEPDKGVIYPNDLLQHILRKINDELEGS